MKACGLVVEYNPLHNGHIYHIQQAKKQTNADCMIAVMSGPFLQRGEPAIVDKFSRTKMALAAGVDLVIELPYRYAVQSSELFAQGAVSILNEIGVKAICFGSESGNINDFITSYHRYKEKEGEYTEKLKHFMNKGDAFPVASKKAYDEVDLKSSLDLSQPNNILGFSYVRTILDHQFPIEPMTIQRLNSHYHDKQLHTEITSATSIRKHLIEEENISHQVRLTMPKATINQLILYQQQTGIWHDWEQYFPILHYRIMTMSPSELCAIAGVDEGLENRIKQAARHATSFQHLMELIKTKRYTWTRLQRMFVHILTNTTKESIHQLDTKVPYIRILGFTNTGRAYLSKYKKTFSVPIVTKLERQLHPMLYMDEKASYAYYAIVSSKINQQLRKQELMPPIFSKIQPNQ